MLQALVVCSSCGEEAELVVEELDDVDREACPCGYSYVVLSVAGFEPVHAKRGEVIPLRTAKKLKRAA
jgi:DNA-directed RNA polymerase subunit RPC12/RpoP